MSKEIIMMPEGSRDGETYYRFVRTQTTPEQSPNYKLEKVIMSPAPLSHLDGEIGRLKFRQFPSLRGFYIHLPGVLPYRVRKHYVSGRFANLTKLLHMHLEFMRTGGIRNAHH